jgi:hypothetical protein
LKVDGYGGVEKSLKDERGLWFRMRKKKEKFEGYRVEKSGTAVPPIGPGRAKLLEVNLVLIFGNLARPCQT